MNNDREFGSKQFDALLDLLSPDRDAAGREYERLRMGLVRFFSFRGCNDADSLADLTLDRVAANLSAFEPERGFKPVTFFYGFAVNLLREYRRTAHREAELTDTFLAGSEEIPDEELEKRWSCFEKCLDELGPTKRKVVLEYYEFEGRDRIEARLKLSTELNCTIEALHVRASRLRSALRECMESCLGPNL
ncbi:MAG: RNA polymerase sigma factor [Pyrinomonadaceae bacterium]